ncbi:SET domain-containing protein [Oryctes borbonicus]|uniref:SET domain-containing protein n=1 Tax=Oryctes borbonicus TaxID=1629725 RepID=A0A0T6AX24_9SCAR|nr:SET domain-containing protein [Oryctes borbonicus]
MNKNHRKKRHLKCSKSRSQSVASERFGSDLECPQKDSNANTFYIKTSKVMGRYMVAGKDLPAGSVILSELPLIVGPCNGSKVQCLGCYVTLEEEYDYTKCNCGWPICSSTCPGIGHAYGHTEEECSVLKESKSSRNFDYKDFNQFKENYNAVAPLRCLLLKETDPKKYEKILTMENHNEIRKNIPELWHLNQTTVVDRMRNDWGLVEFSEDEIHSVCGILEVNCFEVGHGMSIRGLYPSAFLMSHDCVPNTNHIDEENNFRLTVRASTDILVNHPITLSYAYTLQGTLRRREYLLENKFFECRCKRCADPCELGTYTSALICPKCNNGLVLSIDPLNNESSWTCNNKSTKPERRCPGYTVTAKSMQLLISRIQTEIDSIDSNDVESMEKFLDKYRNVLHPTHFLCLGVKLSLSQLYGKITGYLLHELPDDLLYRKMEICREILKIFDVVEPGLTKIRGVTLYELHAPLMILTSRQFENQSISKSILKQRLKEVVRYLEETSHILSYEPENSSEGIMGKAANDALLKIKDWGKIIGRI